MAETEKGKKKIALITGITGQDGSYLTELLLGNNYEVHGLLRRSSSFNTGRLTHLYTDKGNYRAENLKLHYGDMTDMSSLCHIVQTVKPDEIYNLAAQSHVKTSFEMPEYTSDVAGMGFVRLLEAVRLAKLSHTKIYQASTSEMFGDYPTDKQNEQTPFFPCSPYGAAKVFAHHIGKIYRDGLNMFISSGILFNHESPRRGENFVTRKITRGLARIKLGQLDFITLGNLESKRDWGHARDYVKAMWLILQQSVPDDFVISTGITTSVRDFTEKCFNYIEMPIKWKGHGLEEVGIDQSGTIRVKIDERYFRAKEVGYLLGDSQKARKCLGWTPEVSLDDLIREMIEEDIKEARR